MTRQPRAPVSIDTRTKQASKLWEVTRAPCGGACGARHRHLPSGWEVRHCGHPTANRPYYIATRTDGAVYFNSNGLGFQKLSDAKAALLARLAQPKP